MAYFSPGIYSQGQVQQLCAVLRQVDLDVTLSSDNLVLENLNDMNT